MHQSSLQVHERVHLAEALEGRGSVLNEKVCQCRKYQSIAARLPDDSKWVVRISAPTSRAKLILRRTNKRNENQHTHTVTHSRKNTHLCFGQKLLLSSSPIYYDWPKINDLNHASNSNLTPKSTFNSSRYRTYHNTHILFTGIIERRFQKILISIIIKSSSSRSSITF